MPLSWIAVLGCHHGATATGETGNPETDADVDADADADVDADTDADADASGGYLRVSNLTDFGVGLFIDVASHPGPRAQIDALSGTPWRLTYLGERELTVAPTAVQPDGSSPTAHLTIALDGRYTATVFGTAEDLRLLATTDDPSALTGDTSRLAFLHAVVGGAPFDVVDADASTLLVDDLPYGTTGSADVDGTKPHRIGVDLDGDAIADRIYDLPAVGRNYVVPVQFTNQGATLVAAAYGPTGLLLVIQPEAGVTPPDTSDTGP